MKFTITDALHSTNESFYIYNDDYETLDWKSDEPKPTREWCEEKVLELQEEFDGNKYKINRIEGVSGSYAASQGTGSIYPSTGEQLDMLFHELETSGSLTISGSWYKTVKAVKDANPKP